VSAGEVFLVGINPVLGVWRGWQGAEKLTAAAREGLEALAAPALAAENAHKAKEDDVAAAKESRKMNEVDDAAATGAEAAMQSAKAAAVAERQKIVEEEKIMRADLAGATEKSGALQKKLEARPLCLGRNDCSSPLVGAPDPGPAKGVEKTQVGIAITLTHLPQEGQLTTAFGKPTKVYDEIQIRSPQPGQAVQGRDGHPLNVTGAGADSDPFWPESIIIELAGDGRPAPAALPGDCFGLPGGSKRPKAD
jgi:hypothetical protein